MAAVERRIFRRGSTTFFWSSLFFPRPVRQDIFKLYSFVRTVDDLVDVLPQQTATFYTLRKVWEAAAADPAFVTQALPSDSVYERVIKNIVSLARKYTFEPAWVAVFWDAMQSDIERSTYNSLADTLRYVHGSAEVVGLMLCRIMELPKEAEQAAKMQGRAFQWINFVRDIAEDAALGRCYFPSADLRAFKLSDLSVQTARAHPDAYSAFIRFQLERYHTWQAEAAAGRQAIPARLRGAIDTACELYDWTAWQITGRPLIVLEEQVKPTHCMVMRTGIKRHVKLMCIH